VILDGDPIIISSFGNDDERKTAINLFTMAGAAIAITDRYDTIGSNASFFQNPEVLAVHHAGLVGKPVYYNTHGFFFDSTSRDPERWIGQLSDGSWVVGLFNRGDGPESTAKAIDFSAALGLSKPAAVRDLWAHKNLGTMTGWNVSLRPHASSLIKVVPQGPIHYEAEVGAWQGATRFENTYRGYEGLGYVTGLDSPGSRVTWTIAVKKTGRYTLACHVANATGKVSTLKVISSDPTNGHIHGSTQLSVPSRANWSRWQIAKATVDLAAGENVIALAHEHDNIGSVNVDYVTVR